MYMYIYMNLYISIILGTNIVYISVLNITVVIVCFQHIEIDFRKTVEGYVKKGLVDKSSAECTSLLSNRWPELAKKIVTYCKKSKIAAVKEFLHTHNNLVEAGSYDSIFALFLLPLCIKAPPTRKDDPLTKQDIVNSVILYEQVTEDPFSSTCIILSLPRDVNPDNLNNI